MTVLWVALLGIAINTGTAFLFMRGREHDLNAEGAFLHMACGCRRFRRRRPFCARDYGDRLDMG